MLAVQAEGHEVSTVEGLAAAGAALHPVQQAFHECHGLQCGFCTPGFLMSVVGLLDQHPNPTAQQIEEGISGNLCRCTGYASIRRAVHRAVELSSTPSHLRGEVRGAGREPNTPSPLRGEGRGAGRKPA
jgi:carbon-monoxide dehydrogenase small subunit